MAKYVLSMCHLERFQVKPLFLWWPGQETEAAHSCATLLGYISLVNGSEPRSVPRLPLSGQPAAERHSAASINPSCCWRTEWDKKSGLCASIDPESLFQDVWWWHGRGETEKQWACVSSSVLPRLQSGGRGAPGIGWNMIRYGTVLSFLFGFSSAQKLLMPDFP